jgi:parallel beta-helix repeat protein
MNWTLRYLLFSVGIAVVLVGGSSYWTFDGNAESSLPGVKPVVDASSYPSLQSAIDAVASEGGVLQLPPGEFVISEPLVVTQSDVLIQGSGTATHIRNLNEERLPALILRSEGGEEGDPQWRIQLSDFRITGNEKSGHGILAVRVNELYVEGVTVSYHGGDGLRLDNCYEDPRISDSLITYNKQTGLNLIGCHDIVVAGNQFEENQDALRCTDGYNLCMTGNNLDDHLGRGVVVENTYGSVISGNMIEECKSTAILLDRDCYGITLGSNVIAHNGGGIELRDAHGCAVSANTFTINLSFGLRIGPNSGRIAVAGNSFSDSFIGQGEVWRDSDDRAAGGILLDSTSQLTIAANVFSSVKPKALELKGKASREVIFTSNLLVDVVSDHEKLEDSLVGDVLVVEP